MRFFKTCSIVASLLAGASAAPALADGGLFFLIDGDTFSQPYSITNTSTAGETVVGFGLTLIAPYGFDTVNGGFGIDASTAFAVNGGSGVTTGYTGPGSFGDGVTSIAFSFSDFQIGETFTWDIDVDQPGIATVFGNQLIGSTAYADFSNGLRGLGILEAVDGNADAAQFVIRTITTTPPAVPEPATWAMMIGGLGLVGSLMRRRHAQARVAFA